MSSEAAAAVYGYVPKPIDVDLGISIREQANGKRVIMYKRWPGMYLNSAGRFVTDEEAQAAGFKVDADRRKMALTAKLDAYNREVRLQHAENEQRIREGLEPEVLAKLPPIPSPTALAAPLAPLDIITERNQDGEPRGTADFVLDHKGGGRWNVLDRENEGIVFEKLVIEDALKSMVGAQEALNESRAAV